ncbi:MAG TPA: ribonuclease D [Steroidobacteraceae bacterium]
MSVRSAVYSDMLRGSPIVQITSNALQPIITTTAALEEFAAHLAAADAIAVDTEFLRERTYRAELCLIQVASGERAACVDPILLTDVAALVPPLTAARPLKVMHACRQDLEVLYPVAGLVGPIFDTQIAAALTGAPAQVGYADLVRRLLGQDLSKAQTRTDWSIRPLSAAQIEYALDDVRYLLPLKNILETEIEKLGRSAWLAEELAALGTADTFTVEPGRAWLRVKGLQNIDAGRARLLQALAAWRERRATERNRPRGWILEEGVLREIVMQIPRTAEELAAIEDLPASLLKHCSNDILDCVRTADIADPPPRLDPRARPDPAKTQLVRRLADLNQSIAAELSMSAEVLTTRRELEQLADGRRDVPVLHGWRRDVVGERLLAGL